MRRPAVAVVLLWSLVLTGAACGDDGDAASQPTTQPTSSTTQSEEPSPTAPPGPTEPVSFREGAAAVEVTGGDEEPQSWELGLDPDSENVLDPEGGNLDLRWVDAADNALEVGITGTGVEVGVVDSFVRVEVGGFRKPYVDPVHSLCRVEVLELADDRLEGSISCEGLQGFSEQTDGQTVDVEASFSVERARPAAD